MLLDIPAEPFAACLFDCDGTITDSMPLHYVAWKQALDRYACSFPEHLFYSFAGSPATEIISALNLQHGLAMDVHKVTDHKESLFMDNIAQLQPVPAVLEHIRASHGRIPFAVVSGSPRASVELSLKTLGILELFETLVCAGDYTRGNQTRSLSSSPRIDLASTLPAASSSRTETWGLSPPKEQGWPGSRSISPRGRTREGDPLGRKPHKRLTRMVK